MKQGTPLKRHKSLRSREDGLSMSKGLRRNPPPARRKAPKRSQPRRDWTYARAKVEREGVCRLGRDDLCAGRLEAAHIIGREHDYVVYVIGGQGEVDHLEVMPDAIVPLCRAHHRMYDAHEIDLLPALTLEEQLRAVEDADGIENARVRTAPSAYREAA